jgi:hypothetical protein
MPPPAVVSVVKNSIKLAEMHPLFGPNLMTNSKEDAIPLSYIFSNPAATPAVLRDMSCNASSLIDTLNR